MGRLGSNGGFGYDTVTLSYELAYDEYCGMGDMTIAKISIVSYM